LPFIILSAVMRKSVTVEFGLCAAHDSQRSIGSSIVVGGLVSGLGFMFIGASEDIDALVSVGLVLLVVSLITGAVMARMITVKKIDDQHAWFSVGRPFLESLARND
jgi:hypothetical protein